MVSLYHLPLLAIVVTSALLLCANANSIDPHLKDEGHRIVKRFAKHQHEFEGHDIAYVLHEKQPDRFHHVNRRDLASVVNGNQKARLDSGSDYSSLRLDMKNSGDSLKLRLKRWAVVDDTTEFASLTKDAGRVKRSSPTAQGDCFATGHEEGSTGKSTAALSMCNGLHGVVSTKGIDYYIHPVETDSSDETHQVHVLWKRATPSGDAVSSADYDGADNLDSEVNTVEDEVWKTATELTIELALFTDAAGWQKLQELVPGREDEYMLVGVAAANAIYGDKDKVGYDMFFKVKLLEFWEEDPPEYDYQQETLLNMRSCCKYTTRKYADPKFDMHLLHTGIPEEGNIGGKAFLRGVCTPIRCIALRSFSPNRHQLIAHEIGHNLGFKHHDSSDCPDNVKSLIGGMMGGGDGWGYDFSACNKWELQNLFERGRGECLFQEAVPDPTDFKVDQPMVFPGQIMSPDKQCEMLVGFGYKYFRPHELTQVSKNGPCRMFLCVNADPSSPGYNSMVQMTVPRGFPCGDEQFCVRDCTRWTGEIKMGWNIDYLKSLKKENEWSAWPSEWSECSSTCGTGVQIKERECHIEEGPFVTPYCKGSENIKAILCNQTPCPDEPADVDELRKVRGDKMCDTFLKNGVKLLGGSYNGVFKEITRRKYYLSKSCIVACERTDSGSTNLDGLLPSGTPCTDSDREEYDIDRMGIQLRCARGKCMEFSDCIDNAPKDDCGMCTNAEGYEKSRCVRETIFVTAKADDDRVDLTTVPAGSTHISVQAKHSNNGRLEIWTSDDVMIWGRRGGQFRSYYYLEGNELDYAGTQWTLHYKKFILAPGPNSDPIVLKWNVGRIPYKTVIVSYVKP